MLRTLSQPAPSFSAARRRTLAPAAAAAFLGVLVTIMSAIPASAAPSEAGAPGRGDQERSAGGGAEPKKGLHWGGLQRGNSDGPCRDGFELVGQQGTCSHGPDAAPPEAETATSFAAAPSGAVPPYAATTSLPCVGDGSSGSRVEMLYARATDVPDRFLTYGRTLQDYGNDVNATFVRSARKTAGPDVHVRFLTDGNCRPVISRVTLSATGDDNFSNTVAELKALGYDRSDRTYLVWMDASVYCGVATMSYDDRPDATSPNNRNSSFSRVDRPCWNGPVAAHELVHNMGGVSPTAPHGTAAGHCTDENDLMCYSDNAGVTMSQVCADASHEYLLDCNSDDYFSTRPPAGSYLATHWNVTSSCRLTFASCGADNTLTVPPTDTTAAPTVPGGVRFTAATPTSLSLQWDPSQDNVGVAGYVVTRDGGAWSWYVNGDTLVDNGLQPGTTHTYTVAAYDGSGNMSPQSAAVTARTPVQTTAPTVPTGLRTTGVTSSSVALAWTPSTHEAGVAGYRIFRDGVAISTTSGTSFTDAGLSPGTGYAYSVSAYDGTGLQSAQSAPLHVTTSSADTTAPAVPTGLRSPSQTSSSVVLEWDPSTDNVAVTGYRVFRNDTLVASTSAVGFSDTGLAASSGYTYTVLAVDAAGNQSALSSPLPARTMDMVDTVAPSTPTGLTSPTKSSSSISLSWSPARDNVAVAGYRLYRNSRLVATVTGTSTIDTNLAAGTTYTYTVTAFDSAGNTSGASAALAVRTRIVCKIACL